MTLYRSRDDGQVTTTRSGAGSILVDWTYNDYGELATYGVRVSSPTLYRLTVDATDAPRDALGRITR